jgi:hypothetical protein
LATVFVEVLRNVQQESAVLAREIKERPGSTGGAKGRSPPVHPEAIAEFKTDLHRVLGGLQKEMNKNERTSF